VFIEPFMIELRWPLAAGGWAGASSVPQERLPAMLRRAMRVIQSQYGSGG